MYTALLDGPHTFAVEAVDGAGNTQPPPYDVVATIIDTTRPVVTVRPLPLLFTRNSTIQVCVDVVDVTPTVQTVTVSDGGAWLTLLSSSIDQCGTVTVVHDGNHTVVGSAVDAALNPSAVGTYLMRGVGSAARRSSRQRRCVPCS